MFKSVLKGDNLAVNVGCVGGADTLRVDQQDMASNWAQLK